MYIVQNSNGVKRLYCGIVNDYTVLSVNYKPTDEVTDFSDKYTEALKKIDIADYFCDVMANGTFEEKRDLIYTKEVRNIERMFKQ